MEPAFVLLLGDCCKDWAFSLVGDDDPKDILCIVCINIRLKFIRLILVTNLLQKNIQL